MEGGNMKKMLLLLLFVGGISTMGYSQSGKEKEGGFFSRVFKREQKPHGQMRHFDKTPKDPKMKHNGTSYGKKSKHKVDGDGYGTANHSGRKKRKRGVK